MNTSFPFEINRKVKIRAQNLLSILCLAGWKIVRTHGSRFIISRKGVGSIAMMHRGGMRRKVKAHVARAMSKVAGMRGSVG